MATQGTLIDRASAPVSSAVAVGQRRRIAGVGQCYRVVQIVDGTTVRIHTERTDETFDYPIEEAQLDPSASAQIVPDLERFAKLVGQNRTIGPDGPKYEVLSILSGTRARICLIESEEDVDYDIEDILLDPFDRS